jgi:hypothetical protein
MRVSADRPRDLRRGGGQVLGLAAAAGAVYLAGRVLAETRRAELRNAEVRELLQAQAARVAARLDAWELLHDQPAPPPARWTAGPWEQGTPAAALIESRRHPAPVPEDP